MTVQAQALGISVRQSRAFDRAGVAADFAVPKHWEVTTMSAVGRAPSADTTKSDDALAAGPVRRSTRQITWRDASQDG